jgi:nucleoid-associated protein YgaU
MGILSESKAKIKIGETVPATAPAAKSAASGRQYTIQEGDTLSTIAKKFYGASSRWKEIYEANKDVLSSPRNLKLGQVLKIP